MEGTQFDSQEMYLYKFIGKCTDRQQVVNKNLNLKKKDQSMKVGLLYGNIRQKQWKQSIYNYSDG